MKFFMYCIAESRRRDTDILSYKKRHPTRLYGVGWQAGDRKRNITKIVESAAVAVLLFVLFRVFFGIAYVSGESMEPVF